MIESNIIEWLDFENIVQKIGPYSKTYLELYFKFFRTLLKNKPFPIIIEVILMVLSFIQLLLLSSFFLSPDNDIILEILKYLQNFILFFNLITDDNKLYILFIIIFIIILVYIILIVIIIFTFQILKIKIFIKIVNLLNIIIFYYLIGPSIEICLMIFWCKIGNQKYIGFHCFSNSNNIKNVIISIFICLFYLFISIIYSIYNNEIGSTETNLNDTMCRIKCNYEFFYLIAKIIIFIFYFFLKYNNTYIIKLAYEIAFFIVSIIMSIYVYKNVYYYNNIINYIINYKWYFCSWFSFIAIMKIILDLKSITTFIIIGWLFIIILFNKNKKIKEFLLLSEFNILEFRNIKSIEIFCNNLLKLLKYKDFINSKILLYSIINNFENYADNNPEINCHYQKLLNDKYLIKKYDKNDELPILSIIYILYHFQLGKENNKDEITFYMCYFLLIKFHNPTYCMFLYSKIQSIGHKNMYYKYLLAEDIKEYLINKLNNRISNDSLKNIQIGSPILYYLYMNVFKIKIYDAICDQISYFDMFKNQYITNKKIDDIFKTGNTILNIRKEIMSIWNKIIKLNPFNEESYKDYMLYLDTILKDEILAKDESKKYILVKNEKLDEKFNIYNSMFLTGKSSIVLVDGYLTVGKILYATPNFDLFLSYNDKEILNFNFEDLLPNLIQTFYKEIFDDIIKYSNINNVFKKQKKILLKNKNGKLINVKIYIKPVPNLCYGLIYFVYLHKIIDSDFIIMLDNNLKISGFSEMKRNESTFEIGNQYNISPILYGYHICIIIPSIFPLIYYKNGEFNLIKKESKIKGNLYSTNKIETMKSKVDLILDKLKKVSNDNDNQYEIQNEEDKQKIIDEFNNLIKELSKEKIKPYKIFFHIKIQSFLDGKYKYYIIYINDDIISQNFQEKNQVGNNILKRSNLSCGNSISEESKKQIEKQIYYKTIKIYHKIKKSNNKEKHKNKYNNENDNENNNNKEYDRNKENSDNIEIIEKGNINTLKYEYTRISNNIELLFNQIKTAIINKKETYPMKMMFRLNIIFLIATILFLIIREKYTENSFQHLSTFLDENIFFNMTKMGVAVLYLSSINIKWQLHYCSFNTFYNITSLTERMLTENLDFLQWIKDFTNNLGIEFDEVLSKKYDIGLDIYKSTNNEIYKLNNDNLLNYFVNKGINLMKIYPSLLNYSNFKDSHKLESIDIKSELNELDNLINQTYFYFISDINGFMGEDKNKKINEMIFNFSLAFIYIGFFLCGLFIIYIFYTLIINKIEMYFIEQIINFNYNNLEFYLKELEEIKKKIGNDFVDEEEKEEIDINDSNFKVSSFNEEEEEKKDDENKKSVFSSKKKRNSSYNYRKKQIKITKFKRYFFRKNIIFLIQILIIILLYLLFCIISMLIEKNKENEFIDFDSINDTMIGLFKQSYDIFISLKRELELYESSLTNCQIDNKKNVYKLIIPSDSNVKTPDLGDAIIKIIAGLGHKSESLNNLTEMINGDSCKFLANDQSEYSICSNYFWNGILTKGIEQTKVKMSDVIKSIIDELKSINSEGKTFNDIIKSSTYSLYELFIELYYQRAYRIIDDLFWDIRKGKLYNILQSIRSVLIIGIIISIFLFIILIYIVFGLKNLFSSFLNFIAILPQKYLFEEDNFCNDIIRICKNYF